MAAPHTATTPHTPSGPTRPRTTPLRQTYQQLLRTAGTRAAQLRRSLLLQLLSAIVQGLAFACLFPLFMALRHAPDGWAGAQPWLWAMSALVALALGLRWQSQSFDYDGDMTHTMHELRTRLGVQLRRMPLLQLQDKRSGEVNAALLGNVDENLNYTLTISALILHTLVVPLVTALATLWFDWRLGLVLLLVFPAIVPLYRWRRPAFARGMRAVAEANSATSADIVEYTQGLPVLRAANCAGERAARLQASFAHLAHIQAIGQKKGARPNLIIASVVELGLLLVAALGVGLIVAGQLEVAILAAVLVIVVRFSEPLATFVSYTAVLELIETALQRIEALLAVPPLPQRSPAQRPERFDIAFEQVGFRYGAQGTGPAGEAVIDGFSAHLPAHSLTALVGASGSGKTTLTRLLMRHADVHAGAITIGGVDLRTIAPEALMALISVVFQDVYLFDDTVLNNIRMARPEASDAEVETAARAAQCHGFIARLPQGYQTRIGDIGGRLSGGERQRISIARALLKDAPIVVLDEPTAALDSESEVAVQQAIDALVRSKTVIVIAHRLSTIAGAHQILVLDHGRLAESGRHADLLARGGRYAALWRAQQSTKQWRAVSADGAAPEPYSAAVNPSTA